MAWSDAARAAALETRKRKRIMLGPQTSDEYKTIKFNRAQKGLFRTKLYRQERKGENDYGAMSFHKTITDHNIRGSFPRQRTYLPDSRIRNVVDTARLEEARAKNMLTFYNNAKASAEAKKRAKALRAVVTQTLREQGLKRKR